MALAANRRVCRREFLNAEYTLRHKQIELANTIFHGSTTTVTLLILVGRLCSSFPRTKNAGGRYSYLSVRYHHRDPLWGRIASHA
jgi:hypothetical protein